MAAKKSVKDAQPQGILGPVFMGLILAFLGASFGVFHLMGRDITVADPTRSSASKEKKEDADAPTGFFARAPEEVVALRGPARGSNYEAIQRQVAAAQGTVTIPATELNAWSRRAFSFSAPDEPGFFTMIPDDPSFWMDPEQFHVTLELEFSLLGNSLESRYVARGPLTAGGAGLKFAADEMYLGRARIPGAFKGVLNAMLMKAFSASEPAQQLAEPLARVSSVELAEGGMRLSF